MRRAILCNVISPSIPPLALFIILQGFPAEEGPNLKVLVDDDDHEQPTKDNILEGIRRGTPIRLRLRNL